MYETSAAVPRTTEVVAPGQSPRQDARADLLKMILRKEAERKAQSRATPDLEFGQRGTIELRYGT